MGKDESGLFGRRLGSHGRRARRVRRAGIRTLVITTVVSALSAGMLSGAPVFAAPATGHGHRTVTAQADRLGTAVPFRAGKSDGGHAAATAAARTAALTHSQAHWPHGGTAQLKVAAAAGADGQATQSVGGLRVRVNATPSSLGKSVRPQQRPQAPSQVSVRVLDHTAASAAGVPGVLLKLSRADGGAATAQAGLSIDYSSFAYAFGGDYASRLQLVQLPPCALTTPSRAECRKTVPVASDNDIARHTLTAASIPVTPAKAVATASVLAVATTASSGAGSYKATPLNPSASWNAGGSSGDFTWSYPIAVPPSVGGPAPSLALSYDSQSVDGRLPSTNNQPSVVGDGWGISSSYIERSYQSCSDDGQAGKDDECWDEDNATLVLGGKSTPLIKDDTTGLWHPVTDDGERVTLSTGATNGDNDGEYWTVTTADGTQYVFGKNRLPGWVTGKPETNSVWTVPVYGDDANEPCHASTFAASVCDQAWRWNLDYVVDTHSNAMSYWYTKETNSYAQNGATTATAAYTRGGYLNRIDYGITDSTVFSSPGAPMQVSFTTAERCLVTSTETCATLSSSTAADWPDVPFDQICASGAACTVTSPEFFSRKRLTGIATKVYDTTLTTPKYRTVDSWALDQSFPDPGDGTSAGLWLKSITRTGTGADGKTLTLYPVTFDGIQLYNRVDTSDDSIAALVKWRVRTVTSETGSVLTVNYSDTQCVAGTTMPTAPDSNTLRCFPTYWTPPYASSQQLDWFHKYVVTQVTESDPTGGAPLKETDYTYNGTPAWHYATNDLTTKKKYKTWSEWRGYGSVTTTTGDAQSTRTKTVTTYLRGMDGDKQADGTTRSASYTDSQGNHQSDVEALAGHVLETQTYNGVGGAEVSASFSDPWVHTTASHKDANGDTLTARYVRTARTVARTDLASGGSRTRTTTTTYDPATGVATQVDDAGGDAVSGDEQCVRTTLVGNDTSWIRGLPTEVETVDKPCATSPTRPDDVISDVRTLYDNKSFGTIGANGDETSTQRMTSYASGSPVFQTVSTLGYDAQGRVASVADADSNTTSTTYSPATGGPLVSSTVTNAATQSTTTKYEPARGLATSVTDPNNKITTYAYDPLGRLTSVWLPNRVQSAGQTASAVYTYNLNRTTASVVSAGTLNNDGTTYNTTYSLYDALLRPRQSQTPATYQGGRTIAETKYDSRGLSVESDSGFTDSTAPGGALATITSAQPSQTLTTYDGAGRATAADYYANGTKRWTTTTIYGGDRVTVLPPAGSSAVVTITDPLGRTTERDEYDGNTTVATYLPTTYSYDAKGRLSTVTDAAHKSWVYTYDLLGRQDSATDPDSGKTSTAYTDLDQVLSTTDARGKTLSYHYDKLGRRDYMYSGTTQDAAHTLARWTYDSLEKGYPTSAIRYVGGSTGASYITQVAAYDDLYRPTLNRTIIPSVTGQESLAGTYASTTGYNLDGTVQVTSLPAAGDLPSESLEYGYNSLREPTTLKGISGLVQNTTYTATGNVLQTTLGTSSTAKWVQVSNTYEDGTERLTRQLVTDDTHSNTVADTNISYDDSGDPTKISTTANGGTADTQCYRYDGHQRLSDAWTGTDGCVASPSASVLGGPAPYWNSYTYNDDGTRATETVHSADGSTAADLVRSYAYGGTDGSQPHTLTADTTVAGGALTTTTVAAGPVTAGVNTTARTQKSTFDTSGSPDTLTTTPSDAVIPTGKVLKPGGSVASTSVKLTMQTDGNLVLTSLKTSVTLWSSGTAGNAGAYATMQSDGNLTVTSSSGVQLWSTGLTPAAGGHAAVRTDGNLAVYNSGGSTVWSAGTSAAAPDGTITNDVRVFAWDEEGHLSKVTETKTNLSSGAPATSTVTTDYLYDADGNRLIEHTTDTANAANTVSTLYLGNTELKLDYAGKLTATRYYSWGGDQIAVRTAAGLAWQLTDRNNTATCSIDAITQTATWRYTDPFGNPRGALATNWPGDHGFVAGTQDPGTGYTHLGARDYNPDTGRFLSLDPLLEATDPSQLNGYTYAGSNPVTRSDPTGLSSIFDAPGGTSGDSCSGPNPPAPCTNYGQGSDDGGNAGSGSGSGASGGTGGDHNNASGGGGHKSCSWLDLGCQAKKVWHAAKQHPVIAAIVVTAAVVGAGTCIVATAGGCGAVLVAGAEGFTAGAEMGGAAGAVISASTSVIAAGGTTIAAAVGVTATAAGAVAEGTQLAARDEAAATTTAKAAASDTGSTAAREEAAAPKANRVNGGGRTNYMHEGDRFAVMHADTPPIEGFHDVVIHGTPNSVTRTQSGSPHYDHRWLANRLSRDPSYPGGDIRLCACSTGSPDGSFAQNLANKMGVNVLAPHDTLWVFSGGSLWVGPSRFRLSRSPDMWTLYRPGGGG